jgi:hypothetical protein
VSERGGGLRARASPFALRSATGYLAAAARRLVCRQRSFQQILSVAFCAMLMLAVGGCSGGPIIDVYSADYRVTEASAGDSQLLLNILRAKDDLPVHFADLSVIHGSLQMSASASGTFPFAHLIGSATPSSVTPVVGGQSSPTFDVGTLDTQEFTRGMLAPVDLNIIRQLFNQGIDPRIIMILFFSEFRKPNGERFVNTMACDRVHPGLRPELGCLNQAYAYLREIDRLFYKKQLRANVYVGLRPLGGPLSNGWTTTNLGDLSKVDAKQFRMIDKQLYSITEPRLSICYEKDSVKSEVALDEEENRGRKSVLIPLIGSRYGVYSRYLRSKPCYSNEVIVPQMEMEIANGLYVRSAYEILQYLGQVLRFQEEKGEDRCITLSPDDRSCHTGEVLFQVNAPVGAPVVGTRYGGGWYALSDRHCNKNQREHCDYSLQVLAILEVLLNANKAAKDIIAIPRVQVVQ